MSVFDLLEARNRGSLPSRPAQRPTPRQVPQPVQQSQRVQEVSAVLQSGQSRLQRIQELRNEVAGVSRWDRITGAFDANTPQSRLKRLKAGKEEMYTDSLKEEGRRPIGTMNAFDQMAGPATQFINTLSARAAEVPETLRGTAAQLTGNEDALAASVRRQQENRERFYDQDGGGFFNRGTIFDNADEAMNPDSKHAWRGAGGALDLASFGVGGSLRRAGAQVFKQPTGQALKKLATTRAGQKELAKMSASGAAGASGYDMATNENVTPGSAAFNAVIGAGAGPILGVTAPVVAKGVARGTSATARGGKKAASKFNQHLKNEVRIFKDMGEEGFIGGGEAKSFKKSVGKKDKVFFGPDGKPRVEFSDHKAKLKDKKFHDGWSYPLSDVIEHDVLFREYPQLKNIPVSPNSSLGKNVSARTNGEIIEFNPSSRKQKDNPEQLIKSIMHEVDHVIQDKEGFAPGGSPDFTRVPTKRQERLHIERRAKITQKIKKIKDDALKNKGKLSSKDRGAIKLLEAERSSIPGSRVAGRQKAISDYMRLAGEVQSRTVEKRLNMTPAERAKRPFYKDADVPLDDQIVSKGSKSKASINNRSNDLPNHLDVEQGLTTGSKRIQKIDAKKALLKSGYSDSEANQILAETMRPGSKSTHLNKLIDGAKKFDSSTRKPKVSMKRVDDKQISLLDEGKGKPKVTSKKAASKAESGGQRLFKLQDELTEHSFPTNMTGTKIENTGDIFRELAKSGGKPYGRGYIGEKIHKLKTGFGLDDRGIPLKNDISDIKSGRNVAKYNAEMDAWQSRLKKLEQETLKEPDTPLRKAMLDTLDLQRDVAEWYRNPSTNYGNIPKKITALEKQLNALHDATPSTPPKPTSKAQPAKPKVTAKKPAKQPATSKTKGEVELLKQEATRLQAIVDNPGSKQITAGEYSQAIKDLINIRQQIKATQSQPPKPTPKPKVTTTTAKPKVTAKQPPKKAPSKPKVSKKQAMDKKYTVKEGATKERSVSKRSAEFSGNKNVKVQTYKGLNEKAQEAAGKRLVKEDYKYAARVAMGEENPPGNLQAGKVYNAIMEEALDRNDRKLMDKLTERSVRGKQATEAGQFASSFRGGMVEDPVRAINQVAKAREDLLKNAGPTKVSKAGMKKIPKGVSKAEKDEVYRLSRIARKAGKKMNKKDGTFKNEADRLAYGRAMYDQRNYVAELTRVGFKDMGKGDKFRALAGATKSLRATLDNSALGNQTGKVMWTNPKIWARNARKSFVDLYKRFGGKNMQREMMADIMSRENYVNGNYKKLGIDVGITEEAYPISLDIRPDAANNKVSKTFGHTLGRVYGASEAAFVGLQRRNRADLADAHIGILKKTGNKEVLNSKQQMKSLGQMINSLTGRGDLGFAEKKAKDINVVFFSAKLAKSQFDVLFQPVTGAGGSNHVRKEAAKNLTKMMAGYATVLGLADAMKPGSVEWDPRSADFGRIKIGNTRYSVAPGLAPTIVLMTRIGHGVVNYARPGTTAGSFKSSTTGVVSPFTDNNDPLNSLTATGLIGSFVRNKISPAFQVLKSAVTGEKWGGEEWTAKDDLLKDLTVPISLEQAFEDFKRDDMSSMNKAASIIATHTGWFSSSWGDVEGWDKQEAEDRQTVNQMADKLSDKEKQIYRSMFMSYKDEEAGKEPLGAESLDRTANRYKTLVAHPDILEIFKTQERQAAERGDAANPLFLSDMDKKDPNHEVSRMERVMRYRASRDLNAAKQTYTKDGEPLFTELGLDAPWYDEFRKKESKFFDKIMEDKEGDSDGRRMTYSGMKYPEGTDRQNKLQEYYNKLPEGDGPRGGNKSKRDFLNETKEGQELLEFWAERDHFTNAERIAIGLKPILKDEDGNVIDSKTGQPKTSYGSSGSSGGGGRRSGGRRSGGGSGGSSERAFNKRKYAVRMRGGGNTPRPTVSVRGGGPKTVARKTSTAKPKVSKKRSKV